MTAVALNGSFAALTTPNATTQVSAVATFSDGSQQTITAMCAGWASDNPFVATVSSGGLVTAHNSGTSTITATCQSVFARILAQLSLVAPFVQNGTGDNVFNLPTYVTRVKIVGDYPGFSSNFIVRIAGRLVVNELLGSGWSTHHFEGTYVTTGGQVEITNSSGVSWSVSEQR